MKYMFSAAFVLASLAMVPASYAQDGSATSAEQGSESLERPERSQRAERGSRNGGGMGGPPAEAITACEGLTESVVCSFTSAQAQISGTCQMRRDDTLSCRPDGAPAERASNSERADRADRPPRRVDTSVQD